MGPGLDLRLVSPPPPYLWGKVLTGALSVVSISSSPPVWYLVKGLHKIHNDHISLPVTTIQCTIQIADHAMVELNQLGFARPLTSETMLTVSKNAFKG